MNTPKNYVKLGFLKGLVTIEAPTSTPPTPEQLFSLYRSTIIMVCIIAAIAVAGLILLKLSLLNLAWVIPAASKGISWIGSAWRFFKIR